MRELIINGINKSTFLCDDLGANTTIQSHANLVGDELKVKEILCIGSYSFYEIIEKVYGTEESVDKLINRLNRVPCSL